MGDELKTTKLYLVSCEWFPVLTLIDRDKGYRDGNTDPTEFTLAEIVDLQRVQEEFRGWQTRLAGRFSRKHHTPQDFELIRRCIDGD